MFFNCYFKIHLQFKIKQNSVFIFHFVTYHHFKLLKEVVNVYKTSKEHKKPHFSQTYAKSAARTTYNL